MAITLVTPMQKMELALNKVNASWLGVSDNAARFLDLVIGQAITTESTYTFQKVATGRFVLFQDVCLYAQASPAPYTETGGVSSTFNCGWGMPTGDFMKPNVIVTAGTQTGDTLTVTATPIKWRQCMISAIDMIREHRLQQQVSSLGDVSFGSFNLIEELDRLAQQYRGTIYA